MLKKAAQSLFVGHIYVFPTQEAGDRLEGGQHLFPTSLLIWGSIAKSRLLLSNSS